MTNREAFGWALLAWMLLWAPSGVRAQMPTASAPEWFAEHVDFLTRDGGRWIADNSAFQSEEEPFDAYGVEWQRGIGGHGLKGRLFGLRQGVEVATFWEFRTVWHPGEERLIAMQFGATGVFGTGTLRLATGVAGRGSEPPRYVLEQEFFAPGGQGFEQIHEMSDDSGVAADPFDDVHVTTARDSSETAGFGRTYRWRRTRSGASASPR